MKFLYAILAIIAISIISIFTFKEELIYYNYAKYTINNEEENKSKYYYEDNFAYIDAYNEKEIHNENELYETVYYLVNSGIKYAERYFSIEYENFEEDYNKLFSNASKLNYINNFVHPYNSFSSIETSLKGYILEIKINYNNSYNKNNITLIDNEVDKIINKIITNNINNEEKIKTIHDYIVNNSSYDKNYCIKENKQECTTTSPYKSDTAYGVLIEHNGICSGYTDSMAIFLNKLGIINYRVTNDEHTWNAVKLNDKWYHLDATWDDPISDNEILTHTYFLISSEDDSKLKESHTFNKEIFIELS